MKKKVMISMPMKGKTEEQIKSERSEIIQKYLLSDGYEVVNTLFKEFVSKNTPVKYLSKSIEALAEIDCVYFAPGWEKARGCLIEYLVCKYYGIEIVNADEALAYLVRHYDKQVLSIINAEWN